MSSKTLNASVRLNVSQAEKSIDRLVKKINSIDNAINKAGTNSNKVTQQLTKSSNQMNTINSKVKSWANNQRLVTSNIKSTNSALGAVGSKLKMLASTYLGIMGAKAAVTTSDTITSAENKLNYINGYDSNMTQASMDKMYTIANKVRMAYTNMMSNVSKSMVLAGDAFQGNIDNAIRFQEIMSEAYAVGGASAAEQSSSMYQLIQALGSGVLQGDELRSVREGAPLAYKEIEKFAQGVLNSEESLKKLASQGLITSDLVVAAIMNAGDKIDSSFQKTDRTFAQAWNNIKNNAVKAFEPVLQMLNNILNSKAGDAIINGIGYALLFVANTLLWVFDLFGRFFNWCTENWDWMRYVAIFAITAILLWLTFLTARALALAAIRLAMWIVEYWQILLIVIAIAAAVAAIVWLSNTVSDGCQFMISALLVLALAIWVIALVTGNMTLFVIGCIIALAAFFIMFAEEIVGSVYWIGATCYNIAVGTLNALMQAVYAIFVDPIAGIIEWFVNAFSGGFNGILGAIANAMGQLVSMVLSGLKVITKAIDAIGGTNLTAKITGAQDSVKSWGKNSNAVTYKVEAPQMARVSATDAYAKGAKVGSNIQSKVGSLGDSIKNKISGLSDFGSIGTMKELGAVLSGGFNPNGLSLPSMDDPANALKTTPSKSPTDLLKGISDDTDSISDAMDLTKEDLEYLRRIADMEWKKEYTTAEIHVDMSNYNTINGDSDLDGIVTKLADKLYEEMNVLADGVYAY